MPQDHHARALTTLLVGSASSAGAAVVVHALWPDATIVGAALSPLLVALFAELLSRPAGRLLEPRERVAPVLLTALAAFALGGAALTAGERLLERPVGGGDGTTLLGPQRQAAPPPAAQTVTVAAPATTTRVVTVGEEESRARPRPRARDDREREPGAGGEREAPRREHERARLVAEPLPQPEPQPPATTVPAPTTTAPVDDPGNEASPPSRDSS